MHQLDFNKEIFTTTTTTTITNTTTYSCYFSITTTTAISIIIIITIIILGISFMQSIYTYFPETNHVPWEQCVATILM